MKRLESAKKHLKTGVDFIRNKKTMNIIIIVLLFILLIGGVWIRTQNLPLLVDSTTGKNIPIALDPFYFLRVSETMVSEGGLPEYDPLRVRPNWPVEWTTDLTPKATVVLYKIASIFSHNATLQYVNILSPVLFFMISLILFYFLVYKLTNSKITAILSSIFLTIIPSYLYRTMAGFSDHESIGVLGFFGVMLFYILSLKESEKEKNNLKKVIPLALLTGLLTAFTAPAWGGISKFTFLVIPFSFFLIWIIKFQKTKDRSDKRLLNYMIFYFIWVISTVIFAPFFGFTIQKMLSRVLNSDSLMTGITFIFIIIDYWIIGLKKSGFKLIKKENFEKYRIIISLAIGLIVASILLSFVGVSVLGFIGNLANKLFRPFGGGRVGLTVVENTQPYLKDWIGQIGKVFLWMFYLGMVFVGIDFSKGIGKKKNKRVFSLIWIILISGILFSRISSSSILNGENFLSKLIYFGGMLLFVVYFIWLYFKDELDVKKETALIMIWIIFVLLGGRSAIRLFFVMTPLICFMVSYSLFKIYTYAIKSKDELMKTLLILILIVALVGVIFNSVSFAKTSIYQAKNTGPSANYQWQSAMSWVRENTELGSIFVHWWDYGYWVETLGERPTLADGGHFQGDFRTHMIGRYVLTTPNPDTALSFMKSNNVSYLLIDPTDLGKYPAYSTIGSDENAQDRYAWISMMVLNPSQTQETRNGTIRVYQGNTGLDEDIVYSNENKEEIFLPAQKAGVIGAFLKDESGEFEQPQGVYIYNGKQVNLPLRYLYIQGEYFDFGSGVEATLMVIPSLKSDGTQLDPVGALIYLSPKTSKSLFAQLYLMNDPRGLYEGVELVHQEHNQITQYLISQGANLGEFVYFQGFQGPIKIWSVNPPEEILIKEEFLRSTGEYAELDDLQLRK